MLRTFFYGSLVAGAALATAGPVFADVKAGVDAWSRGDFPTAVREWKVPAERGDSDAQFNLAQAYKLGRGVPQDLPKAEALFAQAAAKGHLQASDNLGLLLFQRGERARAMPYISGAADRGDPRAQYLLGLAYFNGENVAKDWVRAYALVTLAQRGGLQQAVPALAQMDQHIPIEQRQQSVPLAASLAAQADATRARQLAAVDLGGVPSSSSMGKPSAPPSPRPPVTTVAPPPGAGGAGADYTRPRPPGPTIAPVATIPDRTTPAAKPSRPVQPLPTQVAKAAPPPQPAASGGSWRVQLGAFGVPGNADALWARIRNRPELAGRSRLNVAAGKITRLQAGGFASQTDAQAACGRLAAAGFPCMPVRN